MVYFKKPTTIFTLLGVDCLFSNNLFTFEDIYPPWCSNSPCKGQANINMREGLKKLKKIKY